MTKQVQQSIIPTHVIGSTGTADTSDLGYRTLANFSGDLAGVGMYRRANILGTVSQSGGVPTGAIIQRGSNANGEFVKYADGTQICMGQSTMTFSNTNVIGASQTLPSAFINNEYFGAVILQTSTTFTNPGAERGQLALLRDTNSNALLRMFNRGDSFNTADSIPVYFTIIGRWF